MPKHLDYCTLLANPEDEDILTRRLFDVNLRLMKTSSEYREIVTKAAKYILWGSMTEKEGYKKPHGFSGANAGIPWNIIAVGDKVMLNPHIIRTKGSQISLSNCGSLLLDHPIKIMRHAHVCIEYWDLVGDRHLIEGYLPTHQHEIDHNLGTLIIDLAVGAS